jgi:hypothetical protein
MPDNSGWMGDPNDIKGRLQFEQSKKGLNPEKAAKEAAAAKAAKAKAAASLAAKNKKKPTPTKAPGVNSFGRTYDEEVQYQRYQKSLNIGKTTKKPKYQIPASPTH